MRSITTFDLQYAHRFYGFQGEAQYLHGHTGTLTKSSEERTVLQTSWGMYPIMNTRLSIQGNISSYIRINESRSVTDRLSSKMKKLFSIYEQKDLSEIKFHFGVPIGFVRDII